MVIVVADNPVWIIIGGYVMQGEFILEGMLNALIEMEDAGDALYNKMSEKTEDPELAAVFKDLATQESHHKDMYESYKNILTPSEGLDEMKLSSLSALIDHTINFLHQDDLPEDMNEAIKRATQFEMDTIQFLMEMKSLIYSKYHSEIDILIEEERKHLDYLENLVAHLES